MIRGHINWIDYGKSLAIFLVVLLHTHCDPLIDRTINAFIMPLFFFMSGYVFSYERNPSYGKFAYKRFRQLVVPYLWINLLAYGLWVAVLRHYGDDAASDIEWSSPLIGIFAGVPPMLKHDIPLWSLLCFFVVEMIFYPLCKSLLRDWMVALGFAGLAFVVGLICDGSRLPLTLGPAIAGVAFYALGHYCRRVRLDSRQYFILPIIAIVGLILSIYFNEEVEFYICSYGNYPLFLLGLLSAIVLIALALKWIGRKGKEPRAIRFIARSTLLICGFHLLAFAAIKGVLLFGFGIESSTLTAGLREGFLFAVTAFVLTLPAAYIVMRFMPWLVDK